MPKANNDNSEHGRSHCHEHAKTTRLADRSSMTSAEAAHSISTQGSIGDEIGNVAASGRGLLSNPALHGRGNGAVHIALMQQAQSTWGNRAVQRFLSAEAVPVQLMLRTGGGAKRKRGGDSEDEDEDEKERKNKKQQVEDVEEVSDEEEEDEDEGFEGDDEAEGGEWTRIVNNPAGRFAEGRGQEQRSVDYMTGKPARHARRMRRKYAKQNKPIAHSRNLMTVITRGPAGTDGSKGRKTITTRASQQQGGKHSEGVIRDTLSSEHFEGHTVIGLPYSERAGCGIGPGFQNCRGTAIPSITGGSNEHFSTIDHPDQRDFMDEETLRQWNDGKFNKGMSQKDKEKVRKKANKAKDKAAKARDKLGAYLYKQFDKAEKSKTTSEEDSGSSYDELTDSYFGSDPTTGKPGSQRKPKRDDDGDDEYVPV
ncbi:MAG TPA: hypothetical protein VEX13_14655 [Chloroflexia bacterium]|nr:hypothetical protein [Chloroflexia bacterium]